MSRSASPAPEPDRWFALTELHGPRVRLVPLRIEHADEYLAALHSDGGADEVVRWLGSGPAPKDVAGAEQQILTALAARARGERLAYAQLDAATGEFIGTTSFYEITPGARAIAIGHTWLGRRWWRTGHNTDSKLLMLTHAFEQWRVHRVALQTDVRNKRSWAAIERIGGQLDGIMRADRPGADDTVRTSARFSIVASEWPAVKARLTAQLGQRAGGQESGPTD